MSGMRSKWAVAAILAVLMAVAPAGAQTKKRSPKPTRGVDSGVSAGVPGGVAGGVEGGVPGGVGWGIGAGVNGGLLEGVGAVLDAHAAQLKAAEAQLEGRGAELAALGAALATIPGLDDPQDRQQEVKEREKEAKEREKEAKEREKERAERQVERESELYDDGTEAIDEGQWEKAASKFKQAADMRGKKADAALYWRAYALNKLGRRDDAILTLKNMLETYPQSRWKNDANALMLQAQQSSGVPVTVDQQDCELKLLAINGLQNMDSSKAVPMLEKFLQSGSCPKVRKQAVFVLAQSRSQEARDLLVKVARGQFSPDLQPTAIQYLWMFGGKENRQVLAEIYSSSSDVDIKRRIIRSAIVGGDRAWVLDLAKNEKDPDLRREAIRQLGPMGGREELWQLYQSESSEENKAQIISALFVGGAADRMAELAKTEKNPDLRHKAIRNLGLMGRDRGGDTLVNIYTSSKDSDDRREALNGLFLQNNAKALVDLARKETDPEMKKVIVQKLSIMHSKEATDYLIELLNK